MRIPVDKFPDRLSVDGGASYINASLDGLDPVNGSYGDWEWDNAKSEVKFMGRYQYLSCNVRNLVSKQAWRL